MEEDTTKRGTDAERLAAAIEQAGGSCASKQAFVAFVKSQSVEINETAAARVLALLIRSAPADGPALDSLASALAALSVEDSIKLVPSVVIEGLKELAPSLDWGKVCGLVAFLGSTRSHTTTTNKTGYQQPGL